MLCDVLLVYIAALINRQQSGHICHNDQSTAKQTANSAWKKVTGRQTTTSSYNMSKLIKHQMAFKPFFLNTECEVGQPECAEMCQHMYSLKMRARCHELCPQRYSWAQRSPVSVQTTLTRESMPVLRAPSLSSSFAHGPHFCLRQLFTDQTLWICSSVFYYKKKFQINWDAV